MSRSSIPGDPGIRFTPSGSGPLVVLDVDSTLIEDEVIELLADAAGSRDLVADVTRRAMEGELDFAQSLRERVATLKGLPVSVFDEVRARVRITRGVPELIAAVHAAGGRIGAVSGGFGEILGPLSESLGLDFARANSLGQRDGRLTGDVEGPIIDAAAKAAALVEWAEISGAPLHRVVAVGDGANDLLMMQRAGLSVAFDAKPAVRAAAHIALPTRDLAQLLPVLGLSG